MKKFLFVMGTMLIVCSFVAMDDEPGTPPGTPCGVWPNDEHISQGLEDEYDPWVDYVDVPFLKASIFNVDVERTAASLYMQDALKGTPDRFQVRLNGILDQLNSQDEINTFRSLIDNLKCVLVESHTLDAAGKDQLQQKLYAVVSSSEPMTIAQLNREIAFTIIDIVSAPSSADEQEDCGGTVRRVSRTKHWWQKIKTSKELGISRRTSLAMFAAIGIASVASHKHIKECRSQGKPTVFDRAWKRMKRGYQRVMRVVRHTILA